MEQMYEQIANMSNKEAAEVLKKLTLNAMVGRCAGKTTMMLTINTALIKAIAALENTPD